MEQQVDQDWRKLRAHLQRHIKALFNLEDTSGIELFSLVQRIAHQSDALDCSLGEEFELSGPRWRLMLRLLIEERLGYREGLTPTALSRSQRVSKNTISSLLRGLEDQGLIQRNLDAKDFRVFRIQLTQAGRELIFSTAPKRIEGLNRLAAGLFPEEREQLFCLLEKLHHSLLTYSGPSKLDLCDRHMMTEPPDDERGTTLL